MATGGKQGKAPPDLSYLQLADRYGYDPTWIEEGWPQPRWQWTERGIDRLLMYIEAVDLARSGKVT